MRLDNIVKKLMSEGRYELDVTRLPLSALNTNAGKDIGEISISMKIIPKAEADSRPCGEGQDDPNLDPYLEKPKIGRDMKDFIPDKFKFDFSFGFFFRFFKYLGALGALATLFAILFINPGKIKSF